MWLEIASESGPGAAIVYNAKFVTLLLPSFVFHCDAFFIPGLVDGIYKA